MYVSVACRVGELSCSWFQWFLSVQTICQQWSLTLALGWSQMLQQCKNGHAERKSCCHKNILLPWDRARRQQRIQTTIVLWNEQFTWFLSITLHWLWKSVITIGCDQQNNNKDCGPFSIANATELAFKGNPGTGRGVSTDRRCFPVYIALRYLYGPVKLDWFSYYRSFQGTHWQNEM